MSPLIFIIFGVTGDLTQRKLMPSIFSLFEKNRVSQDMYIVGVGRRDLDQQVFQDQMKESILKKKKRSHTSPSLSDWEAFSKNLIYVQGQFEDTELYTKLTATLEAYDKKFQACIPRFFYLATPPDHYETILEHLRDSKLSEGCQPGSVREALLSHTSGEDQQRLDNHLTAAYTRVLIEKPFGRNLHTARHLDELLGSIFEERQIYRIDHYLAKETVQNILAFRFANGIFEPTWTNEFIDHVQITVSEDIGIETRGNFYDGIGALRDFVQNHIMQMVSLVAMEQPRAFDAQFVRDERTKVIKSINKEISQPLDNFIIRSQYEEGEVNEEKLQGYKSEKGVHPKSQTETFVAMKLAIDTPRWKDVPFYIRTGKRLGSKVTEISLHYKKPALCYDDVCLFDPEKVYRNVLTIRIHPEERIALRLMVKRPGYGMDLVPVHMSFRYDQEFDQDTSLDAYERLLLDAIVGDQMRFARTDEIDASWQIVNPILEAWERNEAPLLTYKPGTMGPHEAFELIEKDGRRWYLEEK
jgi:glucose-6-phosphate 1-dehydrogenase